MLHRAALRAGAPVRHRLPGPLIASSTLLAARYLSRSTVANEPVAATATAAAVSSITSPPADELGVRSVVLYVYASCPFCNKVIQYLNAARVPYTVVEVNPLFKREISWSADWGKVPVAVVNGRRVVDSDKIIDYVETLLARGAEADAGRVPASSPYVRGLRPLGSGSPSEREYRAWVDSWLVRTLSPNIYRTLGEAWQAFDYLTQRNFSPASRLPAQLVGSVAMWGLSGRLKKKYGITDERAALTDALVKWTDAVGPDRPFLGGGAPDLADCAVYGVLQGIRTTQTEADVFAAVPQLRGWYGRMAAATGTRPLGDPEGSAVSSSESFDGRLEHRVGEAPLRA